MIKKTPSESKNKGKSAKRRASCFNVHMIAGELLKTQPLKHSYHLKLTLTGGFD